MLFSLLSLPDWFFVSKEQVDNSPGQHQEAFAVFTDRNLYIVGENILFTVYNLSDKALKDIGWSTVLYVELVSSEKEPLIQEKFRLGQGGINGYIKIPEDGKYTFYLASNDGSVMYLDDHELINHDGPHSMIEESVVVALHKGMHKIVVKYFQMQGGQGLRLSWKGTGFAKMEIPESVLSH